MKIIYCYSEEVLILKQQALISFKVPCLKWKNWIEELAHNDRDGSGHRLLPVGAVVSGEKDTLLTAVCGR